MKMLVKMGMVIGVTTLLSGCLSEGSNLNLSNISDVVAGKDAKAKRPELDGPSFAAPVDGETSDVISTLLDRRSVLASGSAYDQVAGKILATSSGVAQAELRASKLRAVARSKNWLPTVGPSISLTSLGEFAAGLLVEQVIYDNGKRKAERAFAVADVDVSAVALSQDVNDRIADGLGLYITISEAKEKASMAERGLGRMREFDRVVSERVKGGLSSLSDQRVVRSKISEMEYEAATHREAQSSATSELSALTNGASLPQIDRATGISAAAPSVQSLDVLRAQAEATRAEAEAKVQKASLLPALKVGGILSDNSQASASYDGAGLGLGTKAEMEAIDARVLASKAQVSKAAEQSQRQLARLESQRTALIRQERDTAEMVQQTRANYRLFQDQFEAGKKTVMDVLSVYEQMIREELKHIDLKYEIVTTEIEAARLKGALAHGGDI